MSYFDDPKMPADLVVSDMRMPGMTGFELARRVKKSRQRTKFILITAFEINKEEFEKVLPNVPIDGFLKKPFQLAALLEVLQSA